MNNKTTKIYHGSPEIVKSPQFGIGRRNNDYGLGFYCTENAELAKEWACSSQEDGFSNCYILNISDMNVLNLNSEEYTILNWLAVLVRHRLFSTGTPIAGRAKKYLLDNYYVNVDAFDVVIGYRADDAYYDFADLFLNNGITIEQLARAMKLGKLGEQIVLKSRWAFDNIRYDHFERADHSIYYPLRKERNDDAENSFVKISKENTDGLYMIDILRGEIKNDDARILRNIP